MTSSDEEIIQNSLTFLDAVIKHHSSGMHFFAAEPEGGLYLGSINFRILDYERVVEFSALFRKTHDFHRMVCVSGDDPGCGSGHEDPVALIAIIHGGESDRPDLVMGLTPTLYFTYEFDAYSIKEGGRQIEVGTSENISEEHRMIFA